MQHSEKWDRRFLRLAREVAQWSKDPKVKVGCVVVRPDRTIASLGYNGFPRGMEDRQEWLDDKEVKNERVIHAEMNAVLSAKEPLHGFTAYIWPIGACPRCVPHLAQAGITRLVFTPTPEEQIQRGWEARVEQGLAIAADCGIEWTVLSV